MKILLPTISIAFATAATSFGGGQLIGWRTSPSVGYVSAARIFAESVEGKAEVARIDAVQQQKNTELRAKQRALDATRQQLAKTTSDSERLALQQKELQQRTDVERFAAQATSEVQTLHRQAEAELKSKVKVVLDEVAKAQNVQIVVDEATVVWAVPGMDLTPAVVDRLNSKASSKQ